MKFVDCHHGQCCEVIREVFGCRSITGLEIGTGGGDLTGALLLSFPTLKIYTVDTWEHRDGAQFEAGEPQKRHDMAKELALVKLAPFGERVIIMHTGSDNAYAELIGKVEMDFVWIDGDHTDAQVRRDIQNGLKIIKRPGLIGGHDYGQVTDVTKAVFEEIQFPHRFEFRAGGDFTWWALCRF